MSLYCKNCFHNEVCSLTHCDQSIACVNYMGWIPYPYTGRLPEDGEVVLATVSGKPYENITLDHAAVMAEYYEGEGWVVDEYPAWETPEVTHWMPLPEPQEE